MSGASQDEPLSADAQLLLDLVRCGGYWNVALLCAAAQMPNERFCTAFFDLEVRHLVTRDALGQLQAA